MSEKRLGVGFIGSGFNAKFHMLGWKGVRDADVLGVWSPNGKNAAGAARYANDLDVGAAKPYKSITDMVADPAIDAIWLTGPNHARIENVEELCDAVVRGKGELKGIASEKPLARNVAEAKEVLRLVKKAGLMHGYLENQVFAPQVDTGRDLIWARGAATTGRPYLARAAEEHAGPHMPWFWQGPLKGGGVLSDMMCHSALVVRHLLTKPGQSLATVIFTGNCTFEGMFHFTVSCFSVKCIPGNTGLSHKLIGTLFFSDCLCISLYPARLSFTPSYMVSISFWVKERSSTRAAD